jgi:predicted DNA binding CopG/RHH family protein
LELPGVRKFEARLAGVRMPPEYIAAVKAFASQDCVSFAEYVRDMFHDHVLVRGAAFTD